MALADVNDNTIKLADGRVIGIDGKEVKPKRPMTEMPSNSEAKQIVIRANKRIADLPALPEKLNGISVILTYTLFGLADQEIAIATGLTIEQIEVIRSHDAYTSMLDVLQKNITDADADIIRKTITQYSHSAVLNVIDKMNSDDEKTSLKAAQDVLDRAGYRPADVIEHRHKLEGTLKIVHVDRKSASVIPTLDAFGNIIRESQNGESS
jgi:hypothetical protein